ncbi:hypothetical protein J4458_06945 [Candidatus Woesearchaeota archaeon]|nr:hypothetical protein [Candidatus Woesearchaeota archaeon]
MPTITISLPKELKERLDKRKDINWPEVFRRAFEKKVKYLEEFETLKASGVLESKKFEEFFRKFKEQRGEL